MEPLIKLLFNFCFFLLLVNSVLLTQGVVLPLSSHVERVALLDLRASLGIKAVYWHKKTEPCVNWTGVKCVNGRVTGVNLFGLRRTQFGLKNPRFDIDSLVNCTRLVSFNSSGFYLPGSIPSWLGKNLNALQVLDLRSSSVLGPIPQSIGELSYLHTLLLSDNQLTGIIPDSLSRLSELSVLNLSVNMLTGSIPTVFSALKKVKVLDLSSNSLSGPIPVEFGLLSSLKHLNLSNNSLVSYVPVELANLTQLVDLDLSGNWLFGLLPMELGRLTRLSRLLIGKNNLGGVFPTMNLSHIVDLDVSRNNFTGNFPDLAAFPNAAGVTLNFSNNKFYGNLSFNLPNVDLIDLSNNYLQRFDVRPGKNNTLLSNNCIPGYLHQRSLNECETFYVLNGVAYVGGSIAPVPPPIFKKSSNRLKYVLAGVLGGFGVVVIVVLILVLMLKTCFKKSASQRSANVEPVQEEGNKNDQNVSVDVISFTNSFTYEQMLQATSGFSDANLIKHGHSGDIFSGRLDESDVVIKRIDMRTSSKDCYMSELQLYSKGMHNRLVPFLGHCLEHETEKLMVYKYMPNGDLSNALYRSTSLEDDGLQSLDWITRLKIAIGAAEGLAYLHDECNPPLVHRDIQSSSILLDDKYDVCLGSLSEVCAQEVDNSQNVITKLLRISSSSESTPSGSAPPSCAYDVYCFGKVLLELVTGKIGISNSENTSTKEWLDQTLNLINNYDKESVSKFVDQSLVIDEDLLDEVWAVAIVAKSCLNPKPAKRPQMTHVLKALENPFRVVREEDFSSELLRPSSSKMPRGAGLFGNWRQSFSGSTNSQGQSQSKTNKDGNSSSKLSGGDKSQGSGADDKSMQ